MRLLWLFLRSRGSERATFALLGIVGCDWLWGQVLGRADGALCAGLVLFPLFAGAIVGVVTDSPFAELERAACRSLVRLRAVQIAGLCAIALAGLLAVAWAWPEPDTERLILRHLGVFGGLSLLAALVLGGRLAWIGPVGYGIGSYAVASGGQAPFWVITVQPASSDLALGVAGAVFLIGVTLASWCGARDRSFVGA